MNITYLKILEEIENLKKNEDAKFYMDTNQWYRIAMADESVNSFPKAAILKIGTSYNYRAPMNLIVAVTAAYQSATLQVLCKTIVEDSNKHFDKIRIQTNTENNTFYIDIHYTLDSLPNYLYVNLLGKDKYWHTSKSSDVVEYKTVAEIDI